ncbi:MAG: tRNA/rRNA methyltransferase [Cyclobacteriaceae bacterium]
MQIHFILVNPAVPENVGFAARALKTMGFHSLRLVGSDLHNQQGARNTSYQSHDILDQVEVFEDLPAALKDADLTIGTTAKSRVKRYDYLHPKDLERIIEEKEDAIGSIALVFGSEENGLSNQELEQCDLLSTIPMQTSYPSLNLAQSVLLYAYELSGYSQPAVKEATQTSERLQKELKTKGQEILSWLEVDKHPIRYQRMLDRLMQVGKGDAELLLLLGKYLEQRKSKDG